jgi:hypothetical protein
MDDERETREEINNKADNKLTTDYAEIAKLTALLDVQVKQFVGSMNEMVDSIPSQDALAALWKERVIIDSETTVMETTTQVPLTLDAILGDEAEGSDEVKLL